MALSIGRIWHKNDVIRIPPKDYGGAIYGEMSTRSTSDVECSIAEKMNPLSVDQFQWGLND